MVQGTVLHINLKKHKNGSIFMQAQERFKKIVSAF